MSGQAWFHSMLVNELSLGNLQSSGPQLTVELEVPQHPPLPPSHAPLLLLHGERMEPTLETRDLTKWAGQEVPGKQTDRTTECHERKEGGWSFGQKRRLDMEHCYSDRRSHHSEQQLSRSSSTCNSSQWLLLSNGRGERDTACDGTDKPIQIALDSLTDTVSLKHIAHLFPFISL